MNQWNKMFKTKIISLASRNQQQPEKKGREIYIFFLDYSDMFT